MNNIKIDNALSDIDSAIYSLESAYRDLENELEKTDADAILKLKQELLKSIQNDKIRDEANELCFQKAEEYRSSKNTKT